MKWLPILIYVLAAPTLAGSFVIALLTLNTDDNTLITGTLAVLVIALPLA